ncbi:MAG: STAS/SEC14 domain-containing protein [Methylovulum sp.]|nr:STAS/SEC14 domain-containing protein [Methylovulum sp.]
MALILESDGSNLVVIRSSTVLTRAEADDVKKQVIAVIGRQGKISILIIIEAGFVNVDALANWDDDHDDEFIQKHIIRMAIVGDLKWRDSALLFFLNGWLPFSIKYFKADQEDFARAWLG